MYKIGVLLKRLSGARIFVGALLLVPALAMGQVYQWVDEDGNVHFGDSPPDDANATAVDLPKGPSDAEVEKAQAQLQEALDARQAETAAAVDPAPAEQNTNRPLPDFACYTPIQQVLRGPTKAAYDPVSPTALSVEQQRGVRAILSSAKGLWRGSSVELLCSGQLDSPKSENLYFNVSSTATWRDSQGLLILENRASGSRNRVNETRVSYIEVGDALYYFDAKGDGNQTIDRTISLRGNKAEGLYLDKISLAFMCKRRSFHVMRTELRHLKVTGGKLEFTELYFHNNLLTGSRVWTLTR